MAGPQAWHGPAVALAQHYSSPHIVLGSISKSSCCAVHLTEVKVVIVWALLALRLPLIMVLHFKPAAFSTHQEVTSVKTRTTTTCKCSSGLRLGLNDHVFWLFYHMRSLIFAKGKVMIK